MNNLSLTACSIWIREKNPSKKNTVNIVNLNKKIKGKKKEYDDFFDLLKDFCEKYVHICTGNRKLHFYSVRHAFHHFSIISLHTVSKRTSAPCLMSVLSVYSCGLWLFPFTLGTNIIPTSVISVSIAESWTAPLFMH